MRKSARNIRLNRLFHGRNISAGMTCCIAVALVTTVTAQVPQKRGQNQPDNRQNERNPNSRQSQKQRPRFQQNGGDGPSFRFVDADRDGVLDKQELGKFLTRLPRFSNRPQIVDFLFRRLDANSDGSLDAREFARFSQLGQQGNNRRRRSNGPRENPFPQFVRLLESNTSRITTSDERKTEPVSVEDVKFFETRIQPVLEGKCYNCHSSASPQLRGGLRVDMKHGLLTGGDSGAAVVPGKPDESPIYLALVGDSYSQMPPRERLPDSVLNDFKSWIEKGAVDPRKDSMLFLQKTPQTEIDIEKGRMHWSFQKVQNTKPPISSEDRWSRSDIDRFVWDAMVAADLQPVTDADRRTLLRRVTFDLIGLPPTPEDIEAFIDDERTIDESLAAVVDRLLESPQFGERWGRHWLDVARFGESSGKDVNFSYPNAWRYRDYVIDAFNNDKPYDEFLREQIAGDLLKARDDAERAEHLVATGYLAVGTRSPNESDLKKFLLENTDEQIDALSRGLMGLTIACARCHDHKFDPIRQSDYYALAGIFTSTETKFGGVRGPQIRQATELISLPSSLDLPDPAPITAEGYVAIQDRLEDLRDAMRDLGPRNGQNQQQFLRTSIRISQAQARLASYNADGSSKHRAMGVGDWQASDLPILVRGELDKPAEIVPRGFPEVLRGDDAPEIRRGSGRMELAIWLTDPDHPLTARVMVNRIWQKLFGRGIVPTPDDFGSTGEQPTHPELLDYLASRFVENGWSTKQLIRDILLSRVYRLSSDNNASFSELDPDNIWLWRHKPKRLEAEAIRDAMLFASGELRMERPVGSAMARFGSVPPQFLRTLLAGQEQVRANAMRMETEMRDRNQRGRFRGRGPQQGASNRFGSRSAAGLLRQLEQFGIYATPDTIFPEQYHRSVYLPVVRGQIDKSLAAFDFPDPALVTGQRDTTTVPTQSLYALNDTFVIQQSEKMAKRLFEQTTTYSERITLAFEWTLGRKPKTRELQLAANFFKDWARRASENRESHAGALPAFCQALFTTAEFRQLD